MSWNNHAKIGYSWYEPMSDTVCTIIRLDEEFSFERSMFSWKAACILHNGFAELDKLLVDIEYISSDTLSQWTPEELAGFDHSKPPIVRVNQIDYDDTNNIWRYGSIVGKQDDNR